MHGKEEVLRETEEFMKTEYMRLNTILSRLIVVAMRYFPVAENMSIILTLARAEDCQRGRVTAHTYQRFDPCGKLIGYGIEINPYRTVLLPDGVVAHIIGHEVSHCVNNDIDSAKCLNRLLAVSLPIRINDSGLRADVDMLTALSDSLARSREYKADFLGTTLAVEAGFLLDRKGLDLIDKFSGYTNNRRSYVLTLNPIFRRFDFNLLRENIHPVSVLRSKVIKEAIQNKMFTVKEPLPYYNGWRLGNMYGNYRNGKISKEKLGQFGETVLKDALAVLQFLVDYNLKRLEGLKAKPVTSPKLVIDAILRLEEIGASYQNRWKNGNCCESLQPVRDLYDAQYDVLKQVIAMLRMQAGELGTKNVKELSQIYFSYFNANKCYRVEPCYPVITTTPVGREEMAEAVDEFYDKKDSILELGKGQGEPYV